MDKQLVRRNVINTAVALAYQNSAKKNKKYEEVLSEALDEACKRHNISNKEFIKMFI